MTFAWSDKLKIGIPEIDAQHRSFFACQQRLVEAYSQDPSSDSLGKALDFLENYAKEHFRDEETYMRLHGCAKIEEHIREHRLFSEKVAAIREEYEEYGFSKNLIWFVDHFLLQWISAHIMSFDQFLKWCGGENRD